MCYIEDPARPKIDGLFFFFKKTVWTVILSSTELSGVIWRPSPPAYWQISSDLVVSAASSKDRMLVKALLGEVWMWWFISAFMSGTSCPWCPLKVQEIKKHVFCPPPNLTHLYNLLKRGHLGRFSGFPPGKCAGTASAERCLAPNMNLASNRKVLLNFPLHAKLHSILHEPYWDFSFLFSLFHF